MFRVQQEMIVGVFCAAALEMLWGVVLKFGLAFLLSRSIEKAIGPYYATVRPPYLSKLGLQGNFTGGAAPVDVPKRNAGQSPLSSELQKDFFQMLSCIGPYLHRDVLLLQKVCRVLKSYFSAALSSASSPVSSTSDGVESDRRDTRGALKEARQRVEEALGSCLLPSLQLLPAIPAVGIEIWDVMSLLPYEVIVMTS